MNNPDQINLYWHSYNYFPYEKELANKEIIEFLNSRIIGESDHRVLIENHVNLSNLKDLVYFSSFDLNQNQIPTFQATLEKTCSITGGQNRQSTRYSVHGMHEYKGKFNPQVVAVLINLLGLKPGDKLLDPFCGSGTTLIESYHRGIYSVGWDINPLAVLISNSKLLALKSNPNDISKEVAIFRNNLSELASKPYSIINTDLRSEYLLKWFPKNIYIFIENALTASQGLQFKDLFRIFVSNILRDYSYQEPRDLRIRRRNSPFPKTPIDIALFHSIQSFVNNLFNLKNIVTLENLHSSAKLLDSRDHDYSSDGILFDGAITSPPYATALPYIDTQRLSLVWLNLVSPNEIIDLERKLTGSREWKKNQMDIWVDKLENNSSNLPTKTYDFCRYLVNQIGQQDGFRKQAKPYLIYRYFSDMKSSLTKVIQAVKPGGIFAMVIGNNHTTLGGEKIIIDTPSMILDIAELIGWKLLESIPLQTYQRFGLHQKNSINTEEILILKR